MTEPADRVLVARLTAYLEGYSTFPRPVPAGRRRTSAVEVVVVTVTSAAAVAALVLGFAFVHWGARQMPAGGGHGPAPAGAVGTGPGLLWLVWLVVALVLAATEIHTQAYYALFLAAGAAVAAVTSATGAPLFAQALIGGGAAIAGVFLIRPRLRRLMDEGRVAPYRYPGMAGSLVGQAAVTLDAVGDESHPGHAMLAKERWLAVTDPAALLPAGTEVVVAAVRGTTLLVRARGAPRSMPRPSQGDEIV